MPPQTVMGHDFRLSTITPRVASLASLPSLPMSQLCTCKACDSFAYTRSEPSVASSLSSCFTGKLHPRRWVAIPDGRISRDFEKAKICCTTILRPEFSSLISTWSTSTLYYYWRRTVSEPKGSFSGNVNKRSHVQCVQVPTCHPKIHWGKLLIQAFAGVA